MLNDFKLSEIDITKIKDIQDILDEYYFTVWADSLEADEEFQLLNLEYNLYHKDLINKKGVSNNL